MTQKKTSSEVTQLQEMIRGIQLRMSVFLGTNLAKQGVTLRQFSVLVALVRAGKLKMRELAKALVVSMPAVTHLVDQLEAKRLIRRMPHPTDRRVTLIEMTAAGIKVAAQTQGRALKLFTGVLLQFPKTERQTVQRFMRAMREALTRAIEGSR